MLPLYKNVTSAFVNGGAGSMAVLEGILLHGQESDNLVRNGYMILSNNWSKDDSWAIPNSRASLFPDLNARRQEHKPESDVALVITNPQDVKFVLPPEKHIKGSFNPPYGYFHASIMAPFAKDSPPPAGKDDTDKQSLIIAITALLLSSILAALQLLLSYVTAATSRQKTDSSAIGPWSKHTHFGFRQFWKGKLTVSFGIMDLSVDAFGQDVRLREIKKQYLRAQLSKYLINHQVALRDTRVGLTSTGQTIDLRDKVTKETVPREQLSLEEQVALSQLEVLLRGKSMPSARSSAPLFVASLGTDPSKMKPTGQKDADMIPPSCSTPLYLVRFSDLFILGLLLGMKVGSIDVSKRQLAMDNPHVRVISLRSIFKTSAQFADMFVFSLSLGENPKNLGFVKSMSASAHEAEQIEELKNALTSVLLATGQHGKARDLAKVRLQGRQPSEQSQSQTSPTGAIELQDTGTINVDVGWRTIEMEAIESKLIGDNDPIWEQRWINPLTPKTALLLAIMSNPSVAVAFPHAELEDWLNLNRESAKNALRCLAERDAVVTPPHGFLRSMVENAISRHNSFIAADAELGCQDGGMRSYLATNMAAFVKAVTPFWSLPSSRPNQEVTDGDSDVRTAIASGFPKVPILDELLVPFGAGVPMSEWAKEWDRQSSRTIGKPPSRAVLWLQVSLLDAWIGPMIDRMMGSTIMREVPIPATKEDADACYKESLKLKQTTSWRPVRCQWMRYYLRRLAEGRGGRGDSFMSTNLRIKPEERWLHMEAGVSEEWLHLDAAITLRAAAMYGMLMALNDSSGLSQFFKADPLLFLS
ncbi:hypothetical protein FRC17_009030 [Serendipita sp. 399]|nr:hypothetical protein FRC17_009030 [Serendipita sp. 399]